MIDTLYTKKRIISLFTTLIKMHLPFILLGVIISTLINQIGWKVIFANTSVSHLSNFQYQMVTTNDFLIVTISRNILDGLFCISIFILYKDTTTSIISWMTFILIISIIVEILEISFIVAKIILVGGHTFDPHIEIYMITIFANLIYLFTHLDLYLRIREVYTRIIESTNI